MEPEQDLIVSQRLLRPNILFYEQLIKNILLTINDHAVAKYAMLDECRHYFAPHKTHLISINKFAKTYQSRQAVRWYTKDSFLYRIINKALRAGDMKHCFLLRFYISNLSEQLYQLKCQQQRDALETGKATILFRGLRQSEVHLKILQSLIGQVILTKGFMSTSRDKGMALLYAAPSHPQSLQSQPLLIEISVDMTIPDIIAADIAHLSEFPDEQEVLFDIGTQFRVESLTYNSSNSIWYCRLIAMSNKSQVIPLLQHISCGKNCVDLSTYSEEEAKLERIMRRERRQRFIRISNDRENDSLWSNSPSVSWIANSSSDRARILHQKAFINWHRYIDVHQWHSQCKDAWKVFKQDINNISNDNHDTAWFLNTIGNTCQKLGNTNYAIELLKQAVEIRNRLGAAGYFRAQSLRNLGLAYTDQGDYANALASLNQALMLGQQARLTTLWSTAFTLRNFVYFYHKQGDYPRAIQYCFKASEVLQQCANLSIESE